ncbi:unnamed protein product, partial [Durusdinium trenchii]
DTAAAAIRRARSSFVPPNVAAVKVANIRSHSARHRCINDLKAQNVPNEVGKTFARIKSNSVYGKYGRLTPEQAAASLHQNTKLQDLWESLRSSF